MRGLLLDVPQMPKGPPGDLAERIYGALLFELVAEGLRRGGSLGVSDEELQALGTIAWRAAEGFDTHERTLEARARHAAELADHAKKCREAYAAAAPEVKPYDPDEDVRRMARVMKEELEKPEFPEPPDDDDEDRQ